MNVNKRLKKQNKLGHKRLIFERRGTKIERISENWLAILF
jgi:hypothetical protein